MKNTNPVWKFFVSVKLTVFLLQVSGRNVITASVPQNVAACLMRWDVLSPPPDDHSQLSFIVNLLRHSRVEDLIQVTNHRRRWLEENDRFSRNGQAAFNRVISVIESQGHNLGRLARGAQPHPSEPPHPYPRPKVTVRITLQGVDQISLD